MYLCHILLKYMPPELYHFRETLEFLLVEKGQSELSDKDIAEGMAWSCFAVEKSIFEYKNGDGVEWEFKKPKSKAAQKSQRVANLTFDLAERLIDQLQDGGVVATGVGESSNDRTIIPRGYWYGDSSLDLLKGEVTFSRQGAKFYSLTFADGNPEAYIETSETKIKLIEVRKRKGAVKITDPFVEEFFNRQALISDLLPTIKTARELFAWGQKAGYVTKGKKSNSDKPTPDAIQRAIKKKLQTR